MPQISANGASLHYRFDGPEAGDVVMLSNSLASNLTMWDPQIGPLTEAGFRVLRYDSRGHSQSDAPTGPYSIEQLAEDAVALMDALGLGAVHFCGLSKGGMVAQMLGTRHGGRVRTLAICDSAAYAGPKDTWQGRIDTAEKDGMDAIVDGTIERWFTPAGHARLPKEIAKVRQMILSTPVAGFVACCQAIRDMDQRETIPAVATPTLVIVGAEDPGTPPAKAKEIQSLIPGAEYVELPEAAHLSNIEAADGFNRAVLDFLARNG